jgi:tetratricopeptide (TPR) repeat protein
MTTGKTAIRGVFSTQEVRKVGTGTTTRKTVQKMYWFVEQQDDSIKCQPLNTNYVPSGPRRNITMEELISKFSPEPEFYMNSVFPKMQELEQTVGKADEHRNNGDTFAAEYEYSRALKVDVDNVRANFGIGLTYLERGDTEKAQNIFERLVKLDNAFEAEHKHLFNDFGINLRKNKMLDQSLEYYQRALALSPQDENLHMNMARVFLETKDIAKCLEHLFKTLDIAPDHENAVKFLSWLKQKSLIPADQTQNAQERIQGALAKIQEKRNAPDETDQGKA